MRTSRPAAFWVLFTSVISAAVLVLVVAITQGTVHPPTLAAVCLATVLFALSPAVLNDDMTATLTVVVIFVAIAIGGLPLAVATAVVAGLFSARDATSDVPIKVTYNTAMYVLEAALGAVVFSGITGASVLGTAARPELGDAVVFTLALLAVGLACSLLNAVLMATVVHVTSELPLFGTMRGLLGDILLLQFLNVGLAAIAYVLLASAGAVALLLLIVPVLLARQSLQSVQLRQEAFDRMVRSFVKAIEVKDGYTRGHAERVSDLSVLVAEKMGLSYEDRQLIRYGAILHDVGKIGVSLGILCKAGSLSDDEFDEMKLHPTIGAEMLADIDFLQPALDIVRHHHERMDGRGYPDGLTGDQLPLLTRVVTTVDAFDAMTSTRSYRRALPVELALQEIEANAGSQFDPVVVDALMAVVAEHGWEITDLPVQVAGGSLHDHTLGTVPI